MKPEVYIEDMYDPNDRIALVLVPRQEGAKTQQRIWTAAKAVSEPVQRWLRYNNAQGNDIYVSMNPLSPEARRRRKEDIAEVRRVYLDLDKDGGVKLKKLLRDSAAGKIPGPSYLINTSKDRFQVIWNVKPGELSTEQAEGLMRGLAHEYGGDRAATDVSRVLRLPGFKHRGRDSWIHMSATGQKITEKKDWPEQLFVERDPERELRGKPAVKQSSSQNRTGGRHIAVRARLGAHQRQATSRRKPRSHRKRDRGPAARQAQSGRLRQEDCHQGHRIAGAGTMKTTLPPIALGAILLAEGWASLGTEILALRRMVPWAGSSVDVTSVLISVYLAALAGGYRRGGRLAGSGDPRPRLALRLAAAAAWAAFWLADPGIGLVFSLPPPPLLQAAVYSILGIAPVGWLLAECVLLAHACAPRRKPFRDGRRSVRSLHGPAT